jgi:hypothetical protein
VRLWSSSSVPCLQASRVGAAKSMSSAHWRIVQSFSQQFSKSLAKASPKIVGEFLKPCGSLLQVNCPFAPVSGSSHLNANRGWLASASHRQKRHLKVQTCECPSGGRDQTQQSVWAGDDRMNSLCCLVYLAQVLNWSITIRPWIFDRE